MKRSQKISSKQIKALVVSIIVGVGILSLPGKLARVQANDGWIIIILSGILIVPILIIINRIFQLYPERDFFEIGEEVMGKWVFIIFMLIYLFHFIIHTALISRQLAEIIKAFLLVTTPIEVIIISFIIASSYLSRMEAHIIGRTSYHICPMIVGFVAIVATILLIEVDISNILPVFQSDFDNIFKSLEVTFFSFAGFEILLLFFPFAEDKEENLRSSIKGIGIVTVIYVLIFLVCLSQFGVGYLQKQTFATLSAVKEVDLPGLFIENLDGIVVSSWVLIIFVTMAAYYYSSGKVLSYLLKTKSHDLFIFPLIPIIYIISLIPSNMVNLERCLGRTSNYTGAFSMILMPMIIYGLGYYKVRRSRN